MPDAVTILSIISALSSILNVDRETVQQMIQDEDDLADLQEKLQTIRVKAGFSLSPSFTQPFEEPPAPHWRRDEETGEDTLTVSTEEVRDKIELAPGQKELLYLKFTQLGLLVSKRVDVSIRFDSGLRILTGEEVPDDADDTSHYDDCVHRLGPQSAQNLVQGYESFVGSTEWEWNPYFPPIRTGREAKGKVTGNIFPGDSILIPLWVQTPSKAADYNVDTVANPQNPQIPLSRETLTISVN